MKLGQFDQSDWALIRSQLLWFGSAMLAAGILLLMAQAFVYFSERELAAQRVRVSEMTHAAEQAQQQWQAVQQYQQQYEQLRQIGIIGQEHRLDWLEALSQLKQEQGDWQLDYSFAPQRRKEGALAEHGLALHASEMKVRWRAANEWDISHFAAWLALQTGRAVPKDCLFKRNVNPNDGGIDIECSYDWLTIAAQKEVGP